MKALLIFLFVFGSVCHVQAQDKYEDITHEKVHQLFSLYTALYAEDYEYAENSAFRNLVAKYYIKYLGNFLRAMPEAERELIDWDHKDAPLITELLQPALTNHFLGFDNGDEYENAFFEIDSIVSRQDNQMVVTIPYGSLDGITDSAIGWVWTVYKSGEGEEARPSNTLLGTAKVTLVVSTAAEITIQLEESGELLPELDDNVELRIPGRAVAPYTLLDALTDYNINFQNIYGEPITSRSLFRLIDLSTVEEAMYEFMASDVNETGAFFADNSNFNTMEVEGGRFDGMVLTEALMAATTVDIRMFLGFVRDYPGKYMGNNWKLNETFATWIINNTLLEDEASTWLIDSLKQLHNTDRFEPFIQKYAYYLQDSIAPNWGTSINTLFADGQVDQALEESEVLYDFGQALADTAIILEGMNNIGFSYQLDSAYFKAIDWYTRAIRLDPSYLNAYWNRSNAYSELNQYADAITDLEILFEGAPWFSSAPGNIGWYYLKQGEIEQSAPYIKQAFEMDSSTMAWNVNYGHLLLLTGKKEEAYRFYQRTLDLLTSDEEYRQGPVGDFTFFLEKGWFKSEVSAAKEWMEDQYNRIYSHRVASDVAFDSASTYKDQQAWAQALTWYQKALTHEQTGEQPRQWEIYLYEGWIGRCYQELDQFSEGVVAYRNALDAAKEITTSEVVNSYELLGWIHNEMGQKAKSASYYAEAKALEYLQEEREGSKDLYLVAIGINDYNNMQFEWAESDATALANQFTGDATLLFDRVHKTLLIGAEATREAIQKAFYGVIETAKPGDTFIFYYAGQSDQSDMTSIYPTGAGTDSTLKVPVRLLNNWLSLIPATKQFVMFDASEPGAASELISYFSADDEATGKYRAVLSPSSNRRERDGQQHGMVTKFLLQGLSGDANQLRQADTMISVKELEAFVSGQLAKPQNYGQLLSYVKGIDFALAYAPALLTLSQDTLPPEIEIRTPRLTRGGLTETTETTATIEAKIFDGSGLRIVKLNNKPVAMDEGNILASFVSLAIGANTYVIEAEDEFGNVATDSIIIKRVPKDQSQATADRVTFGKPRSRNVALLIASDSYQEWNNLNNPVRDARAIQRELALLYGFEIDTLFNPTKEQFEDKIYSYLEGNFNENDRLFVFIAGHGVYDNVMQDGYLATYDSKKMDKRKEESYVPLSWLSMKLDRCRFNNIFVMIDACFGGAFGDIQYANSGNKTRLYLTSGNKVYVDDGPKGGHSPFAYGILEVLRNQGRSQGQVTAMSFPVYLQQIDELQTEPRFGAFASSSRDPEFTFEYKQQVSGVRSANIGTTGF